MATNPTREALQKRIAELEEGLAICLDQTDRLKESEQRYRHLFAHSPAMVYLTDLDGVILDINEAGLRHLGYTTPEPVIGKLSVRSLYVDPDDRRRFTEVIEKEGSIQDFETKIRRRDGMVIDVRITAAGRHNSLGKLEGYGGFVVDVTDRKRTQKALMDSEEKYREVVENSLAGIFVHHKGNFLYVNQRGAEIVGYTVAEMIGQPFWLFVHPEDRDLVKARGLKRQKNQVFPNQYTFRVLMKDGTTIWVDMRATRVTYTGLPCVVGNYIDITKSKQAEDEIRHLSRRLIDALEEERKRLAADLHDEYGQILTSLHLDMEALQSAVPTVLPEQTERCRRLLRQVEQLADSVRSTTSRLRPDLLDHLGLVPTLEWSVADFRERRPEIKIDLQIIGLKKRLGPQLEIVLYRIVQECLTNINRHAKARQVAILLTYSHPRVILSVKDDGVGYEQGENRFSPRATPQGIGLLSMRERVAAVGGTMEIHSSRGKGTTIRVELPVG